MSGIRVVADVHEQRSGVISALRDLGVDVAVQACDVGDYLVGDGCAVERKYVVDLHLSVIQGRLWPQVLSLRRHCANPYLLVEGPRLDGGPLTRAAVRGTVLAVIDAGVPVLRAEDAADSAEWLLRLAARSGRIPKRLSRRARAKRRSPERAAESLLAAVPGLSHGTARVLLERFGSVAAVAAASAEELLAVPGVGPQRANAVTRALHAPRRCSS